MGALDHHEDGGRIEVFLDGLADLSGQSFLLLRAAGDDLDGPGQLREADDAVVLRLVRDVGHAREREQVVLAHACEGDVAHDDGILAFLGELASEVLARAGSDACEEFPVGLRDPSRGVEETLSVGVLADGEEDLANRGLDPVVIDAFGRVVVGGKGAEVLDHGSGSLCWTEST